MTKITDKYPKAILVPLEYAMWQSMRKISYDHEISMNEMARMGLEKIIAKYEKKS